jgi:predicted secreted protein
MSSTYGAHAGKRSVVKVSLTQEGLHYVVAGIHDFTHEMEGETTDDSEMTVQWIQRIRGLASSTLTLNGGRRADDITGQNLLYESLRDGTSVWVTVRPTSHGEYRQEMRVSKYGVDVELAGRGEWVCELQGIGAIEIAVSGLKIGTEGGDYLMTEDLDYLSEEL